MPPCPPNHPMVTLTGVSIRNGLRTARVPDGDYCVTGAQISFVAGGTCDGNRRGRFVLPAKDLLPLAPGIPDAVRGRR